MTNKAGSKHLYQTKIEACHKSTMKNCSSIDCGTFIKDNAHAQISQSTEMGILVHSRHANIWSEQRGR